MVKTYIQNPVAIDMSFVGCGQAGSRIADVFAGFTTANKKQTYSCVALNSNDGDLKELKNIALTNRISLDLGGLGKNPEKAVKLLEKDDRAQKRMKDMLTNKVKLKDMVVFIAGLGGGTGTATIGKVVKEFHAIHNIPKVKRALDALIGKLGEEQYLANKAMFEKKAFQLAKEQFVKMGIIAVLPVRSDGPDVLRQVNHFANELWELANNPLYNISFIMFPDNQYLNDKFKSLPQSERKFNNYRDYANYEIASTIHEINTAATEGGTSLVLDPQDLKRAWTEKQGCLVISKLEKDAALIKNSQEITSLVLDSIKENNLHDPVKLFDEDGTAKETHHAGVLVALDNKRDYDNGAFVENAVERLHEKLPISGTVFSGYVKNTEYANAVVTTYSFFKAAALPKRLEQGLVEEYKEFMENNKKRKTTSSKIQVIEDVDSEDLIDFDSLEESLEDLLNHNNNNSESKVTEKKKDILDELNSIDLDIKF